MEAKTNITIKYTDFTNSMNLLEIVTSNKIVCDSSCLENKMFVIHLVQ